MGCPLRYNLLPMATIFVQAQILLLEFLATKIW